MIIDLSLTIDNECLTCGTPWHQKVALNRLGMISEVGRNTSSIVLGSHTATHMDSPLHFFDGKYGIDEINLNTCVGKVTIVDFRDKKAGAVITLADVKDIKITERMMFVFGWYKNWKTDNYYKDFPYFTVEAAKYLMDNGMKLIALDTPSPDTGSAIGMMDDSPVHKLMLAADVVIVEYLCNTDAIDFEKDYELIAMPLKLGGLDGSPSRVVIREL